MADLFYGFMYLSCCSVSARACRMIELPAANPTTGRKIKAASESAASTNIALLISKESTTPETTANTMNNPARLQRKFYDRTVGHQCQRRKCNIELRDCDKFQKHFLCMCQFHNIVLHFVCCFILCVLSCVKLSGTKIDSHF